MKKIFNSILLFCCFNVSTLEAQFIDPPVQTCYHDVYLNLLKASNPTIQTNLNNMDVSIKNYLSSMGSKSAKTNTNITIPVVVYVVHSGVAVGTAENISVNQVLSQINKLNEYFASTGVQFCMATMNNTTALPGTAPNPGIIRINNTTLTDVDANTEHVALTATSTLPSNRYLRIWVVRSINGGAANGYSILPDVAPPAQDGIVMTYKAFGNQATCGCTTLNPNSQNGKILVHEVGHYLGLYHTFEDSCAGMTTATCDSAGDRVCDTPPVSSPNSGCNVSNTCAESPNLPDDINNYMDYTNETCLNHFSNGQISRMNAMIALYKSLMISATNQTYTGVNCNGGLLVGFTSNNNTPCKNTSVTFSANPISGVTSYNWNFGDGTSGSGQVVSHTFTTAISPANVSLTISNGTNSASTIQSYYIESCTPISNSESNWYFYNKNAMSFSTGVPVYNNSAFVNNTFNNAEINGGAGSAVNESCAVQSDSNGNLLFYTDGINVWNKNHQSLNVTLHGHYSSHNGVIITPDPSNSNQYFIFTSGTKTDTKGFKYTKIQVDINNIATAVIGQINIPISVPTTLGYPVSTSSTAVRSNECISAVKHSSGYWILTSSIKNNIDAYILVFNLTTTGLNFVNEVFVKSLSINVNEPAGGNLQISPNGKKIVIDNIAFGGTPSNIFDFDICNGIFSNKKSFTTPGGVYGLEFSSNSKLLYITSIYKIFQFDIESCNPTLTVVADLAPNQPLAMQIGPNNKIYTTISASPQLVVINNPNNICTASNPNACNYNYNGPLMQNGTNVGQALPNIIDAKTVPVFSNSILYSVTKCATTCYTYNFEADIYTTTYNWNFGDIASGSANNTASSRTPSHTFSAAGTYIVSCITSSGTLTTSIVVGALPTIIGSPEICPQNNMIGNYSTTIPSGYSVVWSAIGGVVSGLNNQSNVTVNWSTLPGTVTLSLINSTNGCTTVKTQTISPFCCSCLDSLIWQSMMPRSPNIYASYCINGNSCANNNINYKWHFTNGTTLTTTSNCISEFQNGGVVINDGVKVNLLDSSGNIVCTRNFGISFSRPGSSTAEEANTTFSKGDVEKEINDSNYDMSPPIFFPNPSTGMVKIITEIPVDVSVVDVLGKEVFASKNNTSNSTIDLSSLQKGVYMIKAVGENVSTTEKLILK